jgi:hypothetical protein
MSQEIKTEIASDTIKTANAQLAVDKAHFEKLYNQATEENKALRHQIEAANNIIENDLKADLILKIEAASEYKESDLLALSPTQLMTIEQTLAKGKNFESATATYKSIRAGSASAESANMTVGNLYGKSREEIIKMGGDF